MHKWIWTLVLASVTLVGSSFIAACGDDDDGPGAQPDSGTDSPIIPPADTGPGADTGPDGGCTFAGYVINLINTQTSSDTQPTADLGDTCTPAVSQDEFKSLFP